MNTYDSRYKSEPLVTGNGFASAAFTAGAAATLACIYEATAPKPGNVHPAASFGDITTYAHFVKSAVVCGPVLERAGIRGVGQSVLDAVRTTQAAVVTNTNLGTLLLIAPLAAVPSGHVLADGVADVLAQLTDKDTRLVYEAIRLSAAGGLGQAEHGDVFADPPKLTLVDAMRPAVERDLVARQYTNSIADVFDGPVKWIAEGLADGWRLSDTIVHAHLKQMARHPDSLIARKCGLPVAVESSARAAHVIATGAPRKPAYQQAIQELDDWLRGDGNRRNPGTSADFIAAGLFVLLREGRLHWSEW